MSPPPDSRHFLAAERTLLAYIRTAVAMIGLGFLIARFGLFLREMAAARGVSVPHPTRLPVWIGAGIAMAAAAVIAVAGVNYRREVLRLSAFQAGPAPPSWLASVLGWLMCAVAIATAAYLYSTP